MSHSEEEHRTLSWGDCPISRPPIEGWDTSPVTIQPAPKPAKSRLRQDGRDMFWSITPLVVACILLAGLVGTCSFQLAGPKKGPVPLYDAPAQLRADAEQLGFPVRLPELPDGWQANSGRRGGIDEGRTDPATGHRLRAVISTVGFISPAGRYLSLTQSNADEEKLISALGAQRYPTGSVDLDGVTWVVYEGGESTEPVWTTRLSGPTGPAQIAVTGAGDDAEFRTLAVATQSEQPLTTR